MCDHVLRLGQAVKLFLVKLKAFNAQDVEVVVKTTMSRYALSVMVNVTSFFILLPG